MLNTYAYGLCALPTFVEPALVLGCFEWPTADPRVALRARVEKT